MVASLQEGMLTLTNFFGRNQEEIDALRLRQQEFETATVDGFTNAMLKVGEYRNLIGKTVDAQNTLTGSITENRR